MTVSVPTVSSLAESPAAEVNLPPVGTHEEADVPDHSEYVDRGARVESDDD